MVVFSAVNSHFQTPVSKVLPFSKKQGNGSRENGAVNEGQAG